MLTDKIHQTEIMETTQPNMIESLIEKAFDYGKISLELAKFKAVDKTSNVVSSALSQAVIYFFVFSFLLFLNLGLALWFGELLGKNYYGFLIIAAVYGFVGLIIRIFMYRRIKNCICNGLIKRILN